MPQMGVSVAEGTITEWRSARATGSSATRRSSRSRPTRSRPRSRRRPPGRVTEIARRGRARRSTSETVLATIDTGGAAGRGARRTRTPVDRRHSRQTASGSGAPPVSPVVRRIADEHDVDLSQVEGTGRRGRVTKKDVLAFIEQRAANGKRRPSRRSTWSRLPRGARSPDEPPHRPTATRGRAALAHAQADRRAHGRSLRHGRALHHDRRGRHERGRGGARAAVVPAVRGPRDDRRAARAPAAQRDARGRPPHACTRRCTSGIAVSLGEDGLIVPVVRNAHELSHEGLAARIKDLAERARDQAASTPDEVQRRHVHDHEPGALRRAAGHADHQPAAGGDPRPRGGRQAAGGGERRRGGIASPSGR